MNIFKKLRELEDRIEHLERMRWMSNDNIEQDVKEGRLTPFTAGHMKTNNRVRAALDSLGGTTVERVRETSRRADEYLESLHLTPNEIAVARARAARNASSQNEVD